MTVALMTVTAFGAGLLATLMPGSSAAQALHARHAEHATKKKAANCDKFFPLTDRAWFNDPYETGDTPTASANDVQDLMECTIRRAASGSTIRMVTWNFTDAMRVGLRASTALGRPRTRSH